MARLALYLPKGKSMQNKSNNTMIVYSEVWGCYWTVAPGGFLGDNNWSNNSRPYYNFQ